MLTQERHHLILQKLQERKAITVIELTKELDTSESTIRRDLSTLQAAGKLIKVHGGATILAEDFVGIEEDVATKLEQNTVEKSAIAEYAATLIHSTDFVYIDAGTTTEELVNHITNNGARFVTNGIDHAKKLKAKGCRAYLIGGEFKLSTEAIVGVEAVSNMKKYNFTKCFLGTNGIGLDQGFTTPDLDEAMLKQTAVQKSMFTYILADHTKFGKVSSVTFADLEKAVILTDREVDDRYKEKALIKEVLNKTENKKR